MCLNLHRLPLRKIRGESLALQGCLLPTNQVAVEIDELG